MACQHHVQRRIDGGIMWCRNCGAINVVNAGWDLPACIEIPQSTEVVSAFAIASEPTEVLSNLRTQLKSIIATIDKVLPEDTKP